MNGKVGNGDKGNVVDEGLELDEAPEDTIVLEEDVADIDNVGDMSVEIDVEELVAKIEAVDDDDDEHRKEVHRRLEELNDQREVDKELDSTFDFNIDDDV